MGVFLKIILLLSGLQLLKKRTAQEKFQIPDRHRCVNANKSVRKVVLVGHVTLLAEVIIMTHGTVPSNADDARVTTDVTGDEYMPRS